MTARFKAPYGTPDQHVIGPVHHLGYRALVAYHVDLGWFTDQIIKECEVAHEQRAPKDAVCRQGDDGWNRLSDITSVIMLRRLSGYAAALDAHEKKLAEARRS
jgi:hypothetical protein